MLEKDIKVYICCTYKRVKLNTRSYSMLYPVDRESDLLLLLVTYHSPVLLFLPQDPRHLPRLNRHVAHGGAEQHLVMSFINPTVVFKLTIANCATAL